MRLRRLSIMVSVFSAVGVTSCASTAAVVRDVQASSVSWKQCLSQPPAWYKSAEAVRIADNVLLYQRENGGWQKNLDMAAPLAEKEKAALLRQKKETDTNIDNGATYTQVDYLARVYAATKTERFKDAFLRGLDFLLAAQYENGGWPQYYPLRKGYYTHITFNDNAMIGVMSLLRSIARKQPDYAFVDEERRARAEKAVEKGIACILRCQIVVDGRRTVWCAQHDEKTFAPAPARIYEKVSLSGSESLGIVRFLMGIERPGPEVIQAVQAAVRWFDAAKLAGLRYEEKRGTSAEGGNDRVVVADPAAPPLWARFYEIGTNRPIFSGRDGVIKYRLADIERERRTGYRWYTETPAGLLEKDYPAWQKRWAPTQNVLG